MALKGDRLSDRSYLKEDKLIEEQAFWIAWTQINGVGSISIKRLQQHFGTLAAAWTANREQLLQVEGIGLQTVDAIVQQKSRLEPKKYSNSTKSKTLTFGLQTKPIFTRVCY